MVHMQRIIGFFHGSPSQVGPVRATLSLQQKVLDRQEKRAETALLEISQFQSRELNLRFDTPTVISRHAADWRAQLSVWLSGLLLLLSSAKRTLHL